MSMNLPARLRVAREAAGITQAEIAARTGIAIPNISRIESGAVDVRISTLTRILEAMDLDIEFTSLTTPPLTLDDATRSARRGRARLAAAGRGQSDPLERLDAKQGRGVDVTVERDLREARER